MSLSTPTRRLWPGMHKRSLISEGRSWRSANGFRRYKVSTRPALTRACDRQDGTDFFAPTHERWRPLSFRDFQWQLDELFQSRGGDLTLVAATSKFQPISILTMLTQVGAVFALRASPGKLSCDPVLMVRALAFARQRGFSVPKAGPGR